MQIVNLRQKPPVVRFATIVLGRLSHHTGRLGGQWHTMGRNAG
jgi:hypothetical protein